MTGCREQSQACMINIILIGYHRTTAGHGRRKRGGGGHVLRSRKISGGRPPRNNDISVSFFLHNDNFIFSNIFKIQWPKSEEKLNFGGR